MALGLLAVSILVAAGCGAPQQQARPGSLDVYNHIESLTSCDALEDYFGKAMNDANQYPTGDGRRTIPKAYADATQERMALLECPQP